MRKPLPVVLAALLGLSGGLALAQMRPGHGGGNAGQSSAAPHRGGGGGWRGGGGHGAGGPGYGRSPGIYTSPYPYPYPYAPRTYGSPHGYGNVVFPGTGHAPGTFSPFSITDPTFGARLTNTVSGFGGYGYGYPYYYSGGYQHYSYPSTPVVVPYVVPVYIPYPEPQPQVVPPPQIIYVVPGEPNRSVTTTAPQSQRDGVVTYVVPPRIGSTETVGTSAKKLYLIAFKNHSIYSATEYWVEDDTLHYLTSYGAHNQASLDQIDLEFTVRLNRERGIEFRLEK